MWRFLFFVQDGHDDAELAEIELSSNSSSDGLKKEPGDEQSTTARSAATLNQLIARQYKFLESVRDFKTIQFLSAMAQLAHMDTGLAEHTWLQFFPQVWIFYWKSFKKSRIRFCFQESK